MKVNYLKYSDERNKCFSIKTEIALSNNKKIVKKTPIFPEGKQHISHIFDFQDLLKQYYPNVKICKAYKQGDTIEFEFIEGDLLTNRYEQAIEANDIVYYEKLLQYHKSLICGNPDNECEFENSEKFVEWFGNAKTYEGTSGLKCSNFDAIASNIVMQGDVPVFIDYEWVMDFVMPKDLVVYHCIKDAYLHNEDFEDFYPFKKVMSLLDIAIEETQLEESYRHFFDYVICDKFGKSYAKDKYQCLKNMQSIELINKEWEICANNWKQAVKANENLMEELKTVKKEWESCADNWKAAVGANENLQRELEIAQKEWKSCADNWKIAAEAHTNAEKKLEAAGQEIQKTTAELEQMRIQNELLNEELTAIKNTKVWKLRNKVKNLF